MEGLPGLEIGKRYKIVKGVEAGVTGMVSFQYPFKPPVDASSDGKAVRTKSGGGEEANTSSTSWTVRLPAKVRAEDQKKSEDGGKGSSLSPQLKHKRGRIVTLDDEHDLDEDAEGEAGADEQHEEVFVGEAGPSKNEYLLTLSVNPEGGTIGCFSVEKVDSIARLKHVTAALHQGDGKKQKGSSSKRARR